MEWMLKPLKRYAEFSGRSRRKEFWLFVLFYWIALCVLMYLDTALGLGGSATSTSNTADGVSFSFNMNGGVLTIIFLLAMLIPMLAVSVRRFHDINKSGWMLLLGLIPLAGAFILLVFYVQPGTSGPNRFGADPKSEDSAKVFT